MNNDFINGINFTSIPKIPKPKNIKKQSRKRRNLSIKLVRLFYFLLVLFLFYKGGVYGIESWIAFCRGTDERQPLKEFIEEIRENSRR
jgi:hypothetical protein